MVLHGEPRRCPGTPECSVERLLEFGRQRHVVHPATPRTDEVVVVMAGEILCEFEAAEFVVGDDPMHDAGRLQYGEVPVHRRLGQLAGPVEHLGHGEGPAGIGEEHDERAAAGGVALTITTESHGRNGVQVVHVVGVMVVVVRRRALGRKCHRPHGSDAQRADGPDGGRR